ncbi:MAG: threonine dehydratase [Acidimicrobiales bacterium]|nr:MAG: threonine dehydratase [Acidimicrobiales bacterium]
MTEVTTEDVSRAAIRLAGISRRTPLDKSERLSAKFGAHVWLKREDLQVGRSYKVRGAYNLISSLTDDELSQGVVCASAGNHAQGVALACRSLGVRGRIFVPRTTPRQKRERIASLGSHWVEVVVGGDTYDEAAAAAADEAECNHRIRVPPFDDLRTIAGQGTVAAEITDQLAGPPDLVVVPVGGGGLLAGTAVWMSHQSPGTRLVGVEPAGAASMTAALAKGRPVDLEEIDTFVDGAAVRSVGTHTFRIASQLVDQVVTVPEGQVCTEMLDLYHAEGIIAEPAGALATAALGGSVVVPEGADVVCVVSGGNNDVSRYGEVVERSLVHEGLKHYFLVEFLQEPGALRRFLDEVLGEGDDITLFEYAKKSNRETGPAIVGIELARPGDLEGLLGRMSASPLQIERIPPGSPIFNLLV